MKPSHPETGALPMNPIRTSRIVGALAVLLLSGGLAVAQSCCVKAKAQSKSCQHACCTRAHADRKTCDKCQAEPTCCDKAIAAGKDCTHPCCVEAAKEKKVCSKCNAKKEDKKKS
jgi:hypothetical protein